MNITYWPLHWKIVNSVTGALLIVAGPHVWATKSRALRADRHADIAVGADPMVSMCIGWMGSEGYMFVHIWDTLGMSHFVIVDWRDCGVDSKNVS